MVAAVIRLEKALEGLVNSLTNQGTIHMYKDVVAEVQEALSAIKMLAAITGAAKEAPVKPAPKNE